MLESSARCPYDHKQLYPPGGREGTTRMVPFRADVPSQKEEWMYQLLHQCNAV